MPNEPVVGTISFDELANPSGNPQANLGAEDFTSSGDIKTITGDLALVVQSAEQAKAFITNKQFALLWRDADILYQAPRPMSVYENTFF
jgi:hypothetical protein